LDTLYPDLSGLFVDLLGVPRMKFELAYQQLLDVGDTAPTMDDAKDLLRSLAALLTTDKESRPPFEDKATHCRVFPVILPNGSRSVLTALENFAIIDRQHYALHLRGNITLLDFSMEEVRRLRPFLKWAGLTDRYLSRLVTERTVVDDDFCNEDKPMTGHLVRKAGAFAR
jgi:hypothetical protein